MKILLMNFSPNKKGTTAAALAYAKEQIEALGHEGKIINIEARGGGCLGCGKCKSGGGCIFREIQSLARECEASDALITGTPTHYAEPAATALSTLSRLLYSAKDSVSSKPVFSLSAARRGGGISAIGTLDTFFKFASMPIACAGYPCIVYASGANELLNDKEGLQNIRASVKQLIWLAECIEAGKKAGIKPPCPEEKIKTDIQNN